MAKASKHRISPEVAWLISALYNFDAESVPILREFQKMSYTERMQFLDELQLPISDTDTTKVKLYCEDDGRIVNFSHWVTRETRHAVSPRSYN